MIKNKGLIEEIILGQENFHFKVRTIASDLEEWSETMPFVENSKKLLYNSHLIDGLKLKFKNATIKINARHKFY